MSPDPARSVEITITSPVLAPLLEVSNTAALLAATIEFEEWEHGYEEWVALRDALRRLDDWLLRKES